ncbi:hypothetical protein NHJ13051_001588 [Beauveria bassiana]
MDAISFVLGIKSSHLRSAHLKDLVYRGRVLKTSKINDDGSAATNGQVQASDDKASRGDPKTAWVMAVYEDDSGEEHRWKRSITNQGASEYRINDRSVTAQQYNAALESENILIKARNFLVFQGDVEAIASQSPQDLTRLIEHISGSLEYKQEYENLQAAAEQAVENQNFQLHRRRGINSEIKQYREQKREADNFQKKMDEKDAAIVTQCLWKLFHFQKAMDESSAAIHSHHEDLKELRRNVETYEGQLEAARREQISVSRRVGRVDREIRQKERSIEDRENALVPFDEKIHESSQQVDRLQSQNQKVVKERDEQADIVQKVQSDIESVNKAQSIFEKNIQEQMQKQGVAISDADRKEYNTLRSEVIASSGTDHTKLENLERQRKADEVTVNNLKGKVDSITAAISKTESELSSIGERKDAVETVTKSLSSEIAAKKKEFNQLQSERVRTNQKRTELEEKLEDVAKKLREADDGRRQNDRETRLKDMVASLRRIFPGVRGRIGDLCTPKQKKYDEAIIVALGRDFDSVVVDTEKTGVDCVQYLKEQRFAPMTFIPLDNIKVNAVNTSVKGITGARLTIDTINFDSSIERALSYACGSSVVCETLDVAKHICYEKKIPVKAVTLEGYVIHKAGLMTGGRGPEPKGGKRKFEEADVQNLQRMATKLKEEIDRLPRADRRGSKEETLQIELAGLERRAKATNEELVVFQENFSSKKRELENLKKQLREIQPKYKEQAKQLESTTSTVQQFQNAIGKVEDEIFSGFCKRLGYSDIRAFDASQGKLEQEVSEKRNQYEVQKQRLESRLKWEVARHNDTESRIKRMQEQIKRLKQDIKAYTKEKADIEKEMREEQDELEALRETLEEHQADLAEKSERVNEAKAEVQQRGKDIEALHKSINAFETTLQKNSAGKSGLLRRCRLEQIQIPLAEGALDNLPNEDDLLRQDPDAMDVDAEGEEMSDDPSVDDSLTERITNLTSELEKLNPNMRAMERLEGVESRLKQTDQEYEDSKTAAQEAKEAFSNVKQKRYEIFNKAFTHIQEQISHVYKDLTRSDAYPLGGQAYLDIEEDTDMPYLSGIKYHAMPPLKRFRDMEHLSGGEKTMAALALLFAIHSYQPSPFFVLDEVDAALDNANVDKIKKYIREHAGPGMQFIVISLKTGLFQDSESLVGVYRDQEVNSSRTLTLDSTVMDLAVTLVKSVMRAFYSTRDILVIDALILHEALRDDDLAYLMATNPKDLHKICGKLREDRFLTVHTRPELREGNPRPSNRTWYYINYRHTIDAIKWRVYTIDKDVQGTTERTAEKKEYVCPFCKAEWSPLEVLDSHGPNGFICHRCGHILTFEADRNAGGHEQSTRLNDQFKFMSDLLQKIDNVHIPECDFDRALAKARPVVRDATHQVVATMPMDANLNRPMAVKGLTNTGPQFISVNISTVEGASEAEKEAEIARREKLAAQNALPSWMSNSTVTGESFSGAMGTGIAAVKKETGAGDDSQQKHVDSKAIAQIDDIFETLKAEAAQRQQDNPEDEEGSDEDEDNFEDVPETVNDPSSHTLDISESMKRDPSEEEFKDEPGSEDHTRKRAKIEPSTKTDTAVNDIGDDDDEEEEEEDEMEFEDTNLKPAELHELEKSIPTLTYDVHEAEVVLGRVSHKQRAQFELRRLKLDTDSTEAGAMGHEAAEDGGPAGRYPKRQKLELPALSSEADSSVVRVVHLSWLTESLEKHELLPMSSYIVYEGRKRTHSTSMLVDSQVDSGKTTTSGILERVADEKSGLGERLTLQIEGGEKVEQHMTKYPPAGAIAKPTLTRESTSEHDIQLPLIPYHLHTTYSCQRPTPINPPNSSFIDELKSIRTIRLLQGDKIGVRAYSTSIASIAAYPYKIQKPQEVSRLPGCGSKIAELYQEWHATGQTEEMRESKADPKIDVLRMFYDIWGVGDTTARHFYQKGWRDLDDIVEYGWKSLSRVQQIGVKYYEEFQKKIGRAEVARIADVILDHAHRLDQAYELIVVGGYRRGREENGDVDVILTHKEEHKTSNLVEKLVLSIENDNYITHTLSLSTRNSERGQVPLQWKGEGSTSGAGFDTLDKAMVVWLDPKDAKALHRRVDIIVSPWKTVGCAILGWSGETTFQRDLRRYCKKEKGLKFDSSGIRNRANGSWVDLERGDASADSMEEAERRVFDGLNIPWRPPWDRCTG